MTDLPKFNFSGMSVKSEEELNAKLAESDTRVKYFRPGKHTAKITNVVYQGLASDDRWGKFLLTLTGVGGKETTAQLIIPLRDVMYRTKSGKESAFMFKKAQTFLRAIGVDLTINNVEDVLKEQFSKPEKTLVGQELVIEIGYNGNHIRYDGKTPTGDARYVIQKRDGSVVTDANAAPEVFTTREAALNHAETLDLPIEQYSSVVNYERVAGAPAALSNASGW